MADPAVGIEQTVHGYERGHRLLVSSTQLPDEVASLVNRRSDTAPGYRPSTGPYISGYGLPGGGYALAKTWPDEGAERPNTVYTHTLLVPAPLVGQVTGQALASAFRRPNGGDPRSRALQTLGLDELRKETVEDRAGLQPSEGMAAAATAIYRKNSLVLEAATGTQREGLVLAVWDQHWVPARQRLSFCTGPDATPFEATTRSLTFSSAAAKPVASEGLSDPVWEMVASDLRDPSGLRDWLRFVGSGEADHGLMFTFVSCYRILHAVGSVSSPTVEVQTLLDSAGARPSELRRLKRRLLSFDDNRPQWHVDPNQLLQTLATQRLGQMIATEDASLDRWVASAWSADAGAVSQLVETVSSSGNGVEEPAHLPLAVLEPASMGIEAAIDTQFVGLLTPATLPVAAELAPDRVLEVLAARHDETLWEAWAALTQPWRVRVLNRSSRIADWRVAALACRAHPEAVSDLLDSAPAAIEALVEVIAEDPQESDSMLRPVSGPAARIARELAEVAATRHEVRAASYLVSPEKLPHRVDWDVWLGALGRRHDRTVDAIAYLIGRRGGPAPLRLASVAFADLYSSASASAESPEWQRLAHRLSVAGTAADRRRRLVRDFAKPVEKLNAAESKSVLSTVATHDADAAESLGARLDEIQGREPKGIKGLFRF